MRAVGPPGREVKDARGAEMRRGNRLFRTCLGSAGGSMLLRCGTIALPVPRVPTCLGGICLVGRRGGLVPGPSVLAREDRGLGVILSSSQAALVGNEASCKRRIRVGGGGFRGKFSCCCGAPPWNLLQNGHLAELCWSSRACTVLVMLHNLSRLLGEFASTSASRDNPLTGCE